MKRDELIEKIVTELEDFGWAVDYDYYVPVVSDVLKILEENGTKLPCDDENRSCKGVF